MTPTTMTTSMITTATTMMTDVVVAPSLEGLLVGCVLLLTGTVLVVVVVPRVWGGQVVPTVWEGMVPLEIDAVGMKYAGGIAFQMDGNTTHITLKHVKLITTSIIPFLYFCLICEFPYFQHEMRQTVSSI